MTTSISLDWARQDDDEAKATVNDVDSDVVLRWLFVKGTRLMTCEIRREGREYEVWKVPHWDVSASLVEPFARASDAFWRHAEIAESLRDGGWLLARETVVETRRAVA